ncbi:vWA domain-containing protein [Azospirillum brasilense]|uniref:vWA domain-containing protein n=1 Tax=Azospirillum brasilense TaxID=192 RepID=UPI001EDA4E5E|nr:VWA domain-containing protein [Azospirillum brasilense]UKJ75381.1 VWA domain-containing protein [Azospirillum brasilense]
MDEQLIPDVALKRNKAERLPCVVVVDGSLSMGQSGAIADLNEGLKLLAADLKDDDDACDAVQIAIIRMGDDDQVETLIPFTDAADFLAPAVRANGSTPLGKAVDMAMSMIEDQKQRYRQAGVTYKRPWLFVMSDGEPTDEIQEVASRARQAQDDKKFILWAIGIGRQVNLGPLSQFCTPDRQPVRLEQSKFKEMFKWMSESAKSGSKKASGQQVSMANPSGWMSATL